jgi:hypothetical protein
MSTTNRAEIAGPLTPIQIIMGRLNRCLSDENSRHLYGAQIVALASLIEDVAGVLAEQDARLAKLEPCER